MAAAAPPRSWDRTLPGRVLVVVLLVAYPLLVHFGMSRWSPRVVALSLLCVLLPVLALRMRRRAAGVLRGLALLPLLTVAALVLGMALDAGGFVLAVPVAINAMLLISFGATLRSGSMPMIERFARLQEPALPADKCRWCRQWTVAWCAFFACNGAIALGLALAAPLAWWTVYNGLLAYVLIGLLLATERVARRLRFGPRRDGPARELAWEERPAVRRADGSATQGFRTRLPADYAYFQGHFPGVPVLAGAVQLHELVLPCVQRAQPGVPPPARLTGLKFLLRIHPGDELDVTLQWQEGTDAIDFEITRGGARCSTGRLGFAALAGERPR